VPVIFKPSSSNEGGSEQWCKANQNVDKVCSWSQGTGLTKECQMIVSWTICPIVCAYLVNAKASHPRPEKAKLLWPLGQLRKPSCLYERYISDDPLHATGMRSYRR
jgi:hypothetical protein